jgi:hypothetical protein
MVASDSGNYSDSYKEQFSRAFLESKKLGFNRDPIITSEQIISDEALHFAGELVSEFSEFYRTVLPGYWGNACQTLSTQFFGWLNSRGIPANIVLGNVIINGTDEFDATLEGLQTEFRAKENLDGPQFVHAWISLGGDTIIDAALPHRLVKNYKVSEQFYDMIFIGRASEMLSKYHCQYQPILVGTEFFAKTNPPDPMLMLDIFRKIQA